MSPLIEYGAVADLLRAQVPSLPEQLDQKNWNPESRGDVIALLAKIPLSADATEGDALCVFEEIRTGNLEWSYRMNHKGVMLGHFVSRLLKDNKADKQSLVRQCSNRAYWPYTQMSKGVA
jgi:hypothetical protein